MKNLFSGGIALILSATFLAGISVGFPNGNGNSGGSGNNAGSNNAGSKSNNGSSNNSGNKNGAGNSNNSGSKNNNGNSNNSGNKNGVGNSNNGGINNGGSNNNGIKNGTGNNSGANSTKNNAGQWNNSGKGNGSGVTSGGTNKNPAKSNPLPNFVQKDKSGKAINGKVLSKEHPPKSTNQITTTQNHPKSIVDKKHYHDNVNYHYKHKFGQGWDKDEWKRCYYRWWCFHHDYQYVNGQQCWYDPDVSQWTPYVAGDSIPEDYYVAGNAPPQVADSIRLVNPDDTQATLSYAVNDFPFEIKPGDHQDLPTDRTWVISFNRGGDFGDAQYTLEAGEYAFAPSDHGWELIQSSAADDSANATAPESNLPANPLPK